MNEHQCNPQWFSKRLGKLTASSMEAAMNFNKNGKESQERINLKFRLVSERLTGDVSSQFTNDAMRHGIETEPVAKAVLTELGYEIEDVGFITHPTIRNFGASPDGLLEEGGLLEIKCPTTETHLKWLLSGEIPEEHKPQMLAQLACTGRGWVDFVSFDDRIENPALRIFKRRYEPSINEIKEVEEAAIKFLREVDRMHEILIDSVAS